MCGGRRREDARRGTRIAPSAPAAILAAGGRGDRVGGEIPKQLQLLRGRPMLQWSLGALREAGCSPIVVAAPLSHISEVQAMLLPGEKVVAGGSTRRESVAAALREIDEEIVVIHDAARPLLVPEMVAAVVDALGDAAGATLAVPVAETVKRVEGDKVLETIPRGDLWLAQTPQAFRSTVLRKAHLEVAPDLPATDDAGLVEALGETVMIVPSSALNLKVTLPPDVAIAAESLSRRGASS